MGFVQTIPATNTGAQTQIAAQDQQSCSCGDGSRGRVINLADGSRESRDIKQIVMLHKTAKALHVVALIVFILFFIHLLRNQK